MQNIKEQRLELISTHCLVLTTCTHLQVGLQVKKEQMRGRLSRRHDLVTACYVLSEIEDAPQRRRLVEALWQTTGDTLLLAEPGTPIGSAIIREARWQVCACLVDLSAWPAL